MLEAFAALCTTHLPSSAGGAFLPFLLLFTTAGFLGGFAHCAWMCGPLVLMQTSQRLADVPARDMTELTRLKGAALLPYHLGRITTYTLLGALAGLAGAALTSLWQTAAPLLIVLTGLLLVLSVNPLSYLGIRGDFATGVFKNLTLTWVKSLFNRPVGGHGYALGCVLGFLPCGMVYGALAAAAATGSPFKGALLLFLFGFSTIPALFAVALLGTLTLSQFRKKVLGLSRALTVLAGCWLLFTAYALWQMPPQ